MSTTIMANQLTKENKNVFSIKGFFKKIYWSLNKEKISRYSRISYESWGNEKVQSVEVIQISSNGTIMIKINLYEKFEDDTIEQFSYNTIINWSDIQ